MKSRLTITRCSVSNGKVTASGAAADTFAVLLNPSSYSHQMSISYSQDSTKHASPREAETRPQGQTAAAPQFASINAESVSFELVLDGTGVVRRSTNKVPNVKTDLDDLKDVVYRYVGDKHEPSVVKIGWGDLPSFYGRLRSMSVDYNLFKPSGLPLRARVKLDFVSYMTALEASTRADRSSPDLTHRVQVRDGDTLPLLCHRIYQDASRYPFVARVNKLANFRSLVPGTWLDLPPLS